MGVTVDDIAAVVLIQGEDVGLRMADVDDGVFPVDEVDVAKNEASKDVGKFFDITVTEVPSAMVDRVNLAEVSVDVADTRSPVNVDAVKEEFVSF